jgi:AraC-like DNA-binding protein
MYSILFLQGVQTMHAWEAILKTLDYIEQHVTEDIEIEELAEAAALSVFYYQRLFSRLVKMPAFTRAFKETYGITPEQYREKPISLNQFHKPDLLLAYTLIDEKSMALPWGCLPLNCITAARLNPPIWNC